MAVAPMEPRAGLGEQFGTAKSTLLIDRSMTWFITIGGLGVIIAVLGIFVFILSQILPLFQGASIQPLRTVATGVSNAEVLGVDEWTALPMLVGNDGVLAFIDLEGERGTFQVKPPFPEERTFSAYAYDQQIQRIVFATTQGEFALVDVNYEPVYDGDTRTIVAQPKAGAFLALGQPGLPITQVAYGDSGTQKLVAALQVVDGVPQVHAALLEQKQTLLGSGDTVLKATYDLTPLLAGTPQMIGVTPQTANSVVVATTVGQVFYFYFQAGEDVEEVVLRQVFTPFQDLEQSGIASMEFVFGGVSLVFTNTEGESRLFSLFVPPDGNTRLFGRTKTLEPLPGAPTFYAASLRNKAFLIGTPSRMGLRYSTTASTRVQMDLPYEASLARLSGKYDHVLVLDAVGDLHVYRLNDPHPEAGLKALFGKVWYEGGQRPAYTWQSTGATDDFEPKLSMMPLIFGTLKGTFYAMMFAVPLALLAAMYTSQFLHPNLRTIVKPTMEIMASLPSVILGFLAALWLAPILETRVLSFVLVVMLVPAVALLTGYVWSSIPGNVTSRYVKPGYEFVAVFPLVALAACVAWVLGPVVECLLFVVTDVATGERVADFRLWWVQTTGLSFEQRNSLVVGFIMGFAVIPIIFTIAEDALSNVLPELKAGSLALGASRWQTAIRIVLPTASAGIFSAMMIGLGRAVGETMIVLMATGNTPIVDWNIFSGMRTLSANIAVELPEAPQFGTLYRTLFLGAMLLFLMTFLINTLAELLRQHLREKYKTV
jgi:phosphate transport system permease protein